MVTFKQFIEAKVFNGIDQESITWWANYAQRMTFRSEQEARQWVFDRRQHADRQPASQVFGVDGPEYNRAFADAIPLYQSGKSWKIGKRIRKKPFGWDEVDIRANTLEQLETAGYVNAFDGPILGPVQLVPIRKLYKVEDHSEKPAGVAKVQFLAQQVKNGGYFKAIVYNEDGSILDGHHRYEAAKLLRMTKVPAQMVRYHNA